MIRDIGLSFALYILCYVLGFAFIFVFNSFYAKNYSIPPKKGLLFTVVSYLLIYAWAYVLAWIINGFEWGHHNAIRVYIWFPAVLYFVGKSFKIDFQTACEYMAPSTCFVYAFARLGCVFHGCCYGVPASWGMFSWVAETRCFPVQLIEAVTSAIIGLICVFIAKKRQYRVQGTLYPVMLVLYGANRFIWEFFSAKPRILFGITELGLWALLTALVGAGWLLFLKPGPKKPVKKSRR